MPVMKKQRVKRNTLPRRSSPKGIAKRMEIRAKLWAALPANLKEGYTAPGSTNPRKVGR